MHFLRQSANVMVTFDDLRGIALDRYALNYIRIKSSLRQEFVATVFAFAIAVIFLQQFLGGVLKYFDEFIADQLALRFGIGHSFEQREKAIAGVHILQTHMKILAENALHDFFFSRAEQAVVYKNASELVADCLVQKRSG